MPVSLPEALTILKRHEPELRARGVVHASVFGSVARGEAQEASDVDVMVELDGARPLDLFDYVRIRMFINDLLDGRADVVTRKSLKPRLRPKVLGEAVDAF